MCQNLISINPNHLYIFRGSYIPAHSVLARSKIENDAKGKTSNEKCTIKKNILNYNDEIISASSTNEKCTIKKNILNYNEEIISASSTTIAIKNEK